MLEGALTQQNNQSRRYRWGQGCRAPS